MSCLAKKQWWQRGKGGCICLVKRVSGHKILVTEMEQQDGRGEKRRKKRMQKARKWSGSAAAEGLRARAGGKGKERGRAEAQRGSKPHPTSGGLYLTR